MFSPSPFTLSFASWTPATASHRGPHDCFAPGTVVAPLVVMVVVMVVMVVLVAALLALLARLAAAAVSSVHVFGFAQLARVGPAPLGPPVALLLAGPVRVRLTPVGLASISLTPVGPVSARPLLTALVLTASLLAVPLLAAPPVPTLPRLVGL